MCWLRALTILVAALYATTARADIYQWEWIDPNDHSQGRQQSSRLAPDGAGREAVPGANLNNLDLTMAWLQAHDLHQASFFNTTLTYADLGSANLTGATFGFVALRDADFSNAEIRGAWFASNGADWSGSNMDWGLTAEQLYSTASYQEGDLRGISFGIVPFIGPRSVLSGWNFSGQNLSDSDFSQTVLTEVDLSNTDLTNARFNSANLALADLAGATVQGTSFHQSSLTAEQLYSTTSYQEGDLSGIWMPENLRGWNLAGQNLTDARFSLAKLTNANLRGAVLFSADLMDGQLEYADLRDADLTWCNFRYANMYGANLANVNADGALFLAAWLTAVDARGASDLSLSALRGKRNFIHPDGHVEGLSVREAEVFRLWDNSFTEPIPIVVQREMSIDPNGVLRAVFEDDQWGSTITFEPSISVTLAGTLMLEIDDEVSWPSLVGTTYQLFDWTGVTPAGAFDTIESQAGTTWETSGLYTTGEVTLVGAVPEPSTLLLGCVALAAMAALSKRRRSMRWPASRLPRRHGLGNCPHSTSSSNFGMLFKRPWPRSQLSPSRAPSVGGLVS